MIISNSIIANSIVDCISTDSIVGTDTVSIIEDGSCIDDFFSDLEPIARVGDPGLEPLADNGGLTQTHALSANSIARNTGNTVEGEFSFDACTTNDQRGQLRDDGDGACDVGAIEFNPNDATGDAWFNVIRLGNGKVVVLPL